MIQDALRVIGEVDDDHARRITGIVSNLIDVTPSPAAFSPDEAAHDWAMLTDGTVTSEDLGRFTTNLAAAGLDPQSLEELAKGKVVTALPAGAFSYLENLYGEAGADGVMELQQQLLADGSTSALDAATVSQTAFSHCRTNTSATSTTTAADGTACPRTSATSSKRAPARPSSTVTRSRPPCPHSWTPCRPTSGASSNPSQAPQPLHTATHSPIRLTPPTSTP